MIVNDRAKHTREWHYEPVYDWYVRYVTIIKDGKKYLSHKEVKSYYHGKSSIPKVKKKKKCLILKN